MIYRQGTTRQEQRSATGERTEYDRQIKGDLRQRDQCPCLSQGGRGQTEIYQKIRRRQQGGLSRQADRERHAR